LKQSSEIFSTKYFLELGIVFTFMRMRSQRILVSNVHLLHCPPVDNAMTFETAAECFGYVHQLMYQRHRLLVFRQPVKVLRQDFYNIMGIYLKRCLHCSGYRMASRDSSPALRTDAANAYYSRNVMRHVQPTRDFLNLDFYVRSFRIFHIHNTHSFKLKFTKLSKSIKQHRIST